VIGVCTGRIDANNVRHAGVFDDFSKHRQRGLAVFRNHDLEQTRAYQGVCGASEHAFDGVADIDQAAVGGQLDHDVGDVAKEFFQTFLSREHLGRHPAYPFLYPGNPLGGALRHFRAQRIWHPVQRPQDFEFLNSFWS